MADLSRTVAIIFEGEDRVTVATDKIARTFTAVGAEGSAAAAKVDALNKELDKTGEKERPIAGVANALKAFIASLVVKDFVDANVAFERFGKSLEAIGTSGAASKDALEFVKRVSNELGIEVRGAAESYVQLSAATSGTNLAGERTNEIFRAVAGAMASLGKSSAETNGAFLAITQIVSKGTVSMEELRQQLGERLPGALQIAARSTGRTTEEFEALVKSGRLTAEEFLPKFAAALNETFGGSKFDGFENQLGRLKNAITEAFVAIGDSGAFAALARGIEIASGSTQLAVASFVLLGSTIEAVIEKFRGGSNVNFGDLIAKAMERANEKGVAAITSILGVDDATKKLNETATGTGAALSDGLSRGVAGAKELKAAAKDLEAALKALGIDAKTFIDPVDNINEAFSKVAESAKATGDQIVTGLIGALRNLPAGASASGIAGDIDKAFKAGRLTAEEYAQAIALIKVRLDGASPSFQAVTEDAKKQKESLDKSADSAKRQAEETRKAEEAAQRFALEMQRIASNERIKSIEAKVTLDVANVEAGTERVKAAFASIGDTINSTGSLLGNLFKLFEGYDNLSFAAIRQIERQIDLENASRQSAFELQRKLTEAQIAQITAQTRALERNDAIIKVDGAGLQPHLEAFMWEILKTIQVRVNQDGLDMLLGV